MASSSLVAAAPHHCYASPRANDRCSSYSGTNLIIPRSFPGRRACRRLLHHELRVQHFGLKEIKKGNSCLGSTWKPHIHNFNEEDVTRILSRKLCCLTHYRTSYKFAGHIKMHNLGVIINKSTFPIPKHAVFSNEHVTQKPMYIELLMHSITEIYNSWEI